MPQLPPTLRSKLMKPETSPPFSSGIFTYDAGEGVFEDRLRNRLQPAAAGALHEAKDDEHPERRRQAAKKRAHRGPPSSHTVGSTDIPGRRRWSQSSPGKPNPHREPLYNLDVVAGRVLWRQKTVELAGRAGHALDITIVIASRSVGVNRDRLPAMHPAQLCFAEIRGDPDVVERNHGEQLLTGLHPLTHLDSLVTHNPGRRGDDMRVAQVESGPIERSFSS